MAPNLQDLRNRAQADRKRAERELSAAQAAQRRALAANVSEAELEPIVQRTLDARDLISTADGQLGTLDGLIREEDEYAERSRQRASDGGDIGAPRRRVSLTGVTERERPIIPVGPHDGRASLTDPADVPVWHREQDGRRASVRADERMSEHPVVAEMAERDPGRHVAETYSGIGQYVRALSTTGSSGIVPTIWSGNIIDRARNVAQVMAAGAEVIPMDSKTLQIGRLLTDPTPAWLNEAGTRTASDPSFDSVQLVSRTLACLTVASLEFLQDAVNADQVVEEAIGKAMGLEIDRAALFSGVAAGEDAVASGIVASPPGPLGILGNLLANQTANILGSATNGTPITAATPWNELLNTYFVPVKLNEQPTAILMNAGQQQKYAETYDTLGQPLRPPPVLENVPILVTNQIPSVSHGTGTLMTDLFCGDFRQLLVGTRMEITVQTLVERYAELGQVGILSTFRGDIVLARPKAFSVYRYLGGL
jgi:HK97 family phage major capsid protein